MIARQRSRTGSSIIVSNNLGRQRLAVVQRGTSARYYHEVSYAKAGDPQEVLAYQKATTQDPSSDSTTEKDGLLYAGPNVLVEMHYAPWNPADVNLVQGKYPSPYPPNVDDPSVSLRRSVYWPDRTVAGAEGYGRVVQSRRGSPLRPGDWVTVGHSGMGTLRSAVWLPSPFVVPLLRGNEVFGGSSTTATTNKTAPDATAAARVATLFQLGGTALQMLRSFVNLQPGDVVIQNAGNSAVGIVLSQLAKLLQPNVRVVSIVRRGDNKTPEQYAELVQYLQNVAKADLVVAQEDLIGNRQASKELLQSDIMQGPRPLAINAVGGTASDLLFQLLSPGGTHVTYGGMSMRPVTIATSHLIFKDVRSVGYWHSRYMMQQQTTLESKVALVNEILDAYLNGHLTPPPVQVYGLADVKDALSFANQQSQETIRSKVVFDCRE